MFKITWQAETRMLLIEMSGFWSCEDAARYETEVKTTLGDLPAKIKLLFDVTSHPPQSGAIVEVQGQIFAATLLHRCDAIAVVGATALLQRQIKRAAGSVPIHFSVTEAAAMATLLASDIVA